MKHNRVSMLVVGACVVVFALGLAQTGCAATEKQVVNMKMQTMEKGENVLGYGNCQWLYPSDKPREKLRREPSYGSKAPIYYAAIYGDSADSTFTLVLDESRGTSTGYDCLYVDENNDNCLDEKEKIFPVGVGTPANTPPPRPLRISVTSGGRAFPYCFNFTAFVYSDEKNPVKKIHANLRDSSYFVGTAVFDEKPMTIAIADLNSNGLFSDPEQGIFRGDRFFVDLDGDGKFTNSRPSQEEGFPYGDYTFIKGKWYAVKSSPDGQTVRIAPASPPMGAVEAPEWIAYAVLRSKSQTQRLEFSGKQSAAIAGAYRLCELGIAATDSQGKKWGTTGSFGGKGREMVIPKGGFAQIAAGPPMRVEIQTTLLQDKGTIGFDLAITGSAGENYRCPASDRGGPRAEFEIRNKNGRVVLSKMFQYG